MNTTRTAVIWLAVWVATWSAAITAAPHLPRWIATAARDMRSIL